MRPLIIYHGPGCMDGAGAALAAWTRFGDDAEYCPAQYGDAAPADGDVDGREVYILDFSYPRPELVRIAESAERLVVLDHHKTAAQDLAGLPFATFDMNKSGAVLAWEYFHPGEPVPELLLYIQDRDLWQWRLDRSKQFSAALAARGCGEDFRRLISLTGERRALCNEGEALLAYQSQMIDRVVHITEHVSLAGAMGLAACSPHLQSEIGEQLALRCGGFGAVWYWHGPDQVYRVSLRSRSDLDVSTIAREFGGGGHKNAAGFECRELPWRQP